MQNGTIKVESKENEGTVFTFMIPYKINNSDDQNFIKTNVASLVESASKKILLCEDNELNQKLITTIFENTNHSMAIAFNGLEAISHLNKQAFDLILMDLQMPKMDGYETTTYIREKLKLDIPIIALTANSLVYEKEKCMNMGMNDYLSKPFSKKDLFDLINKYFFATKEISESKKMISLDTLKEFIGNDARQLLIMIQSFENQLKQCLSKHLPINNKESESLKATIYGKPNRKATQVI